MRRKYEITNNKNGGGSARRGGEGMRRRRSTGRDGEQEEDEEITEGRTETRRQSRIKVDQLHLQIAGGGPRPASPSLWGSLPPDYMKLG